MPDAALYHHTEVMCSVLPIQDAVFCSNANEELAFPISKSEMFACLMPIFLANLFAKQVTVGSGVRPNSLSENGLCFSLEAVRRLPAYG